MKYRGEEVGRMSDSGLRQLIQDVRQVIGAVGPQHSLYEVISDAEAHLAGKPAIVVRPDLEMMLANFIQRETAPR